RHTRFSRDWSSDVCSSDLHCCDRGVEGISAADVIAHLGDGFMSLSAQLTLASIERYRIYLRHRAFAHIRGDEFPQALEEARCAKIGRASCRGTARIAVVAV